MFNVINVWSHRGNPKQLEYTQHKHQSNHLLEPLNFQKIYLVFDEEKKIQNVEYYRRKHGKNDGTGSPTWQGLGSE